MNVTFHVVHAIWALHLEPWKFKGILVISPVPSQINSSHLLRRYKLSSSTSLTIAKASKILCRLGTNVVVQPGRLPKNRAPHGTSKIQWFMTCLWRVHTLCVPIVMAPISGQTQTWCRKNACAYCLALQPLLQPANSLLESLDWDVSNHEWV